MPIADRQLDFAYDVKKKLEAEGLRVEVDDRSEKIGYKIRSAQLEKIPYMLVIGDKEMEAGTVSLRSRKEGDLGAMPVADVVAKISAENKDRV